MTDTDTRIVTPEEAQTILAVHPEDTSAILKRYAYTVATEPGRVRAAVEAAVDSLRPVLATEPDRIREAQAAAWDEGRASAWGLGWESATNPYRADDDK